MKLSTSSKFTLVCFGAALVFSMISKAASTMTPDSDNDKFHYWRPWQHVASSKMKTVESIDVSRKEDLPAKVDTIVIAGVRAKLEVGPSLDERVHMHLHGRVHKVDEDALDVEIKGRKMEIKVKEDKMAGSWRFLITGLGDKDYGTDGPLTLSVLVPNSKLKELFMLSVNGDMVAKDLKLEKLSTNSVAGEMNLTGISTDELEINTVNGDVDVNGGTMRKGKILTVSGEVSVAAAVSHLDLTTTSGDASVKLAEVRNPVTLRIDSTSGDIDLKGAAANPKGRLAFDTTSGDLDVAGKGGDTSASGGASIPFGVAGDDVQVKTTSGDLNVH